MQVWCSSRISMYVGIYVSNYVFCNLAFTFATAIRLSIIQIWSLRDSYLNTIYRSLQTRGSWYVLPCIQWWVSITNYYFFLNYTSGNQLMIIFLSAYMENAFPADELMPLSCKVCMNSSRLTWYIYFLFYLSAYILEILSLIYILILYL